MGANFLSLLAQVDSTRGMQDDILQVLGWVFMGVGAIMVPFALYLGFKFMSATDANKRKDALKHFVNVLVSLVIIIVLITFLVVWGGFSIVPQTRTDPEEPGINNPWVCPDHPEGGCDCFDFGYGGDWEGGAMSGLSQDQMRALTQTEFNNMVAAMSDEELLMRVVRAETSNAQGQHAVANVIFNRMAHGGQPLRTVLLAPNQFSPALFNRTPNGVSDPVRTGYRRVLQPIPENQAIQVANAIAAARTHDLVNGSRNFLAAATFNSRIRNNNMRWYNHTVNWYTTIGGNTFFRHTGG